MTPGTLISAEDQPTSITGARAWRVRYASRDVNGVSHEVTGLVIAPAATGADRPIMTWCHGTTGLGDAACPSAQPDPARELTTYFTAESTRQIDYGVPGLRGLIDDGWVVCATDYQGLGTEGMHQYVVNRTNALDAVNIAHAARALDTGAGTRLGCMGWSQGGGTAAAVAELDPDDYRDLNLVGTVPMSPAVPSVVLANPGAGGPASALSDPTTPPDSHLVMLFCGFHAANPTTLSLSDVFTPLGEEIIRSAWNHQPVHHLNDTIARLFRLRGPILQKEIGNKEAWLAAVAKGSAAQTRPVAPVLMCVDSFDGGTVVPVTWQTEYAAAVTKLGGDIETREYPHDDHFSLPQSCVGDARVWLRSKLS
jgi:cephalosporin-C deacetylase-like acetyl esterase